MSLSSFLYLTESFSTWREEDEDKQAVGSTPGQGVAICRTVNRDKEWEIWVLSEPRSPLLVASPPAPGCLSFPIRKRDRRIPAGSSCTDTNALCQGVSSGTGGCRVRVCVEVGDPHADLPGGNRPTSTSHHPMHCGDRIWPHSRWSGHPGGVCGRRGRTSSRAQRCPTVAAGSPPTRRSVPPSRGACPGCTVGAGQGNAPLPFSGDGDWPPNPAGTHRGELGHCRELMS